MKRFEIKVTGNGTKRQIAKALRELADSILKNVKEETVKTTLEDATLCTDLTEDIF